MHRNTRKYIKRR